MKYWKKSYSAKTKHDGQTYRRGRCNISRPRAYGAVGDNNKILPKKSQQGTNVAHNVRGGLLIDLTIVAIALLLRYTLSMSLKLTDITQWNVGAVVLEQF